MRQNAFKSLTQRRLQVALALFFLALATPATTLIVRAYGQLKWEAFHQSRILAEELVQRIDGEYRRRIASEEARPFTDYAFLNIAGDPTAAFLQRSPLSAFPVKSEIPGLIGYFQVDAAGRLSTPLLPAEEDSAALYGISESERAERLAQQEKIAQILGRNRLVSTRDVTQPRRHAVTDMATGALMDAERAQEKTTTFSSLAEAEPPAPAQSAFDQLSAGAMAEKNESKKKSSTGLGRVEELRLESNFQRPALDMDEETVRHDEPRQSVQRSVRKEQNILPAPALAPAAQQPISTSAANATPRITTFESEIDPLEISLLDSGHFVLFRKVWRNGERTIQGMLIEQQAFIQEITRRAFSDTALARMSDLIIAYRGDVLGMLNSSASRYDLTSSSDLRGELLYQTPLAAPLGDIELIFSITRLPAGPGGKVVLWTAAILSLVLCSGFYLMYRLGLGQIRLAQQQQDFVSAVSHELKTPLTSIRMYSEMLREEWVGEEKKRHYYNYIHDESERLSRLINNVLQLARMTRSEMPLNMQTLSAAELIDLIRAKVTSLAERAGFELCIRCEESDAHTTLAIDPDHFTQIVINLVDNAIKFSTQQATRRIEISCSRQSDNTLLFTVRDHGPGIARDQMKKIFTLFYRSKNELTRETVGTGIGLALVQQLTRAMHGQIDVINRKPGAEFRVSFPSCT